MFYSRVPWQFSALLVPPINGGTLLLDSLSRAALLAIFTLLLLLPLKYWAALPIPACATFPAPLITLSLRLHSNMFHNQSMIASRIMSKASRLSPQALVRLERKDANRSANWWPGAANTGFASLGATAWDCMCIAHASMRWGWFFRYRWDPSGWSLRAATWGCTGTTRPSLIAWALPLFSAWAMRWT